MAEKDFSSKEQKPVETRPPAIKILLARLGRKSLYLIYRHALSFAKTAERWHAEYIHKWRWSLPKPKTEEPTEEDVAEVLKRYYRHLTIITEVMPIRPKISILMPIYKVQPEFLEQALGSIAFQAYPNWEACLVDDCSADPRLTKLIEDFAKRFPQQVRFESNERNLGISETSNRALSLATGEYIALLDHDDLLYPNSLAEIVRHINLHESPDILYSDERTVDQDGYPVGDIYYKPKWSPFMHLAVNYTTHLTSYKTTLVRQVGGFRKGYEGSQDHDLMMRMCEATKKPVAHIPMCLYQWRAHVQSTAANVGAKPYAAEAGIRAITEACERRGTPAEVFYEPSTLHYRVKFRLPNDLPLISIIIPTRNRLDLIRSCIDSILQKTTYPHFEILVVDNGSDDPDCLSYLNGLPIKHQNKIRIIHDGGPFNFARLNNRGAREAAGEFLLLLNNDTEVISSDWLYELVRVARLPGVGAVGGKLLYPNGTLQHAGVSLAGRQLAKHVFSGRDKQDLVYSSYVQTMHESSCITGACLMIEKQKYQSVEGLDEIFAPNGFGDIDFCLKLLQRGWSNIYTPYAELFHHESPSRGLSTEVFEQEVLLKRWPKYLMDDPYRNFVLDEGPMMSPDRVRMVPELLPKEMKYLLRSVSR